MFTNFSEELMNTNTNTTKNRLSTHAVITIINSERRRREILIEDIVSETGISDSSVKRILGNNCNPNLDRLVAILSVLGISIIEVDLAIKYDYPYIPNRLMTYRHSVRHILRTAQNIGTPLSDARMYFDIWLSEAKSFEDIPTFFEEYKEEWGRLNAKYPELLQHYKLLSESHEGEAEALIKEVSSL